MRRRAGPAGAALPSDFPEFTDRDTGRQPGLGPGILHQPPVSGSQLPSTRRAHGITFKTTQDILNPTMCVRVYTRTHARTRARTLYGRPSGACSEGTGVGAAALLHLGMEQCARAARGPKHVMRTLVKLTGQTVITRVSHWSNGSVTGQTGQSLVKRVSHWSNGSVTGQTG